MCQTIKIFPTISARTGDPAPPNPATGKPAHEFVTPSTVGKIHKLLKSCFNQAVKWELMEKNPAFYAAVPKYKAKKREIWDAETLMRALDLCENERLKLNGGDIKSVQGDSGRFQVDIVTDVYSHIIDEDRKKNAELFEDAFFTGRNADPGAVRSNTVTIPEGVDPEFVNKVLSISCAVRARSNPEMMALLSTMAAAMKK